MILLNERVWRAPTLETSGKMTTSSHAASRHRVRVSQRPPPPAASEGAFRRRRDPGVSGGHTAGPPGVSGGARRRAGPWLPLLPSGRTAASALSRAGTDPQRPPAAPAPAQLGERAAPPRAASPSGLAGAPVKMAAAGGRRRWLLWAAGNGRAAGSPKRLPPGRAEGRKSGGVRRREKGRGKQRAAAAAGGRARRAGQRGRLGLWERVGGPGGGGKVRWR